MNSPRLVWISLAGLILAGALGFGVTRSLQPTLVGSPCDHSQAANLALSLASDADTRQRVLAQDAAFGTEFAAACDRLCAERARLSDKLIMAKTNDPEVATTLAQIHVRQAQMELLTWNHIIAVRDLLPEAKRLVYVRRVREDWARGQTRLHTVANAGMCRMPGHSGKWTNEQGKERGHGDEQRR
jgi:hypothetical protein